MRIQLKNNAALIIGLLIVLFLQLLTLHNSMFWDTVHFASIQPNYFFNNHFSDFVLPDEADSGHIPGFALYIAGIWSLFGRSLENSHLAMMPFAIGIVWQLHLLCKRFITPQYSGLALLMVLMDPSLLSQLTLVSPDVVLVFAFLLAMNSILRNQKILLSLSILVLFGMSSRGMTLSLCLLILDLYCNVDFRRKALLVLGALIKRSLIYIPAVLLLILYYSWHFHTKGWLILHTESPWAAGQKVVDAKGLAVNLILLGWRLVDFGRIIVWLIALTLFIHYRKSILRESGNRPLILLLVCLIVLMSSTMLWASNLIGHRYLIPFYLLFALFCTRILFSEFVPPKFRKTAIFLWIAVLSSGNFWVYPSNLAQGWDSTPAHLPYYELRHEAIDWLEKEAIHFKEVQTFFPNYNPIDRIDLNGKTRGFEKFDGNAEYVFFSNIYNVPDSTQERIRNEYNVVKRFERRGVYIVIYKKKL